MQIPAMKAAATADPHNTHELRSAPDPGRSNHNQNRQATARAAVWHSCAVRAQSVLREQPVELGLDLALAPAVGIDPAAAQTAIKSSLQFQAHFLGRLAPQRKLDQASQRRTARRPR
jgi:hypothetical protein